MTVLRLDRAVGARLAVVSERALRVRGGGHRGRAGMGGRVHRHRLLVETVRKVQERNGKCGEMKQDGLATRIHGLRTQEQLGSEAASARGGKNTRRKRGA